MNENLIVKELEEIVGLLSSNSFRNILEGIKLYSDKYKEFIGNEPIDKLLKMHQVRRDMLVAYLQTEEADTPTYQERIYNKAKQNFDELILATAKKYSIVSKF